MTDIDPKWLAERFWRRVQKTPTCWEWAGWRHRQGYGLLNVSRARKLMAHRVAWILHYGPIPEGMNVLHACDRPECVNPAHLFLGTTQDNTADMVAKKRQANGERVGNAKLTTSDVIVIRQRVADGQSKTSLGREFGVSRETVTKIAYRHAWKHLL